jgi:hypothetical protein
MNDYNKYIHYLIFPTIKPKDICSIHMDEYLCTNVNDDSLVKGFTSLITSQDSNEPPAVVHVSYLNSIQRTKVIQYTKVQYTNTVTNSTRTKL